MECTPKISVIVPVYKVEKYLVRCIESILRQTEEDYELILVDDGSPDRCPEICDAYAQRYNRIRVIHQKNSGLSVARNAGMAIAKGQYIAFVDSDDWIHCEYLRFLADHMEGCDMVCCDYWRVTESRDDPRIVDKTFRIVSCAEALAMDQCRIYAWARMYRRDKIAGYRFVEGMKAEDRVFNAEYLASNLKMKVGVLSAKLYFYFKHPDTITGQAGFSVLPAIQEMVKIAEETRSIALIDYLIEWLNVKLENGIFIGDPPDYDTVRSYIRQSKKLKMRFLSSIPQKIRYLCSDRTPELFQAFWRAKTYFKDATHPTLNYEGMAVETAIDRHYREKKYNEDKTIQELYTEAIRSKRTMWHYLRLKKEIFDPVYTKFTNEAETSVDKKPNRTVWLCRMEESDYASDIVQVCYQTVQRTLSTDEWKIQPITEENLDEYVRLPESVMKKYRAGKIPKPLFIDMIKLDLLVRHGGCWMDSTVLVTGRELFDRLTECDLAAPNMNAPMNTSPLAYEDWFLWAKAGNVCLRLLQKCLYAYWEKYDSVMDRRLCGLFFSMVMCAYEDEKAAMPYLCAPAMNILGYNIGTLYSERKMKTILEQSDIHKLPREWKETADHYAITYYAEILRRFA